MPKVPILAGRPTAWHRRPPCARDADPAHTGAKIEDISAITGLSGTVTFATFSYCGCLSLMAHADAAIWPDTEVGTWRGACRSGVRTRRAYWIARCGGCWAAVTRALDNEFHRIPAR